WSHPFFVPVRPRCSRSASRRVVQGATSSCLRAPLTVSTIRDDAASLAPPAGPASFTSHPLRPKGTSSPDSLKELNPRAQPARNPCQAVCARTLPGTYRSRTSRKSRASTPGERSARSPCGMQVANKNEGLDSCTPPEAACPPVLVELTQSRKICGRPYRL